MNDGENMDTHVLPLPIPQGSTSTATGNMSDPSFCSTSQLSPTQIAMLYQAMHTIKDSTQKVASDHRDLHSSVSKVSFGSFHLRSRLLMCYLQCNLWAVAMVMIRI